MMHFFDSSRRFTRFVAPSLTCAALLSGALAFSAPSARAEADEAMRPQPAQAEPVAEAPAPAETAGPAPAIDRQTAAVKTGCFPPALRAVLERMGGHFGGRVIVTSGHRSRAENRRAGGARGSLHMRCLAADVQIAGVAPAAIARFARAQPEVGGVGAYRHTRSVHVDVGARKFAWRGMGGRSAGRIRLAMR
jgi:hypothetical protein